jgi:glucose-1-phosphate adenylyltransferase
MEFDDYILSFVMAGGRGSRLEVLTKDRSKPAVSILGHYRIFDFVATNIANTGIPAMLVATQFAPSSLCRHIGDGRIWSFDGIDKRLEITHPYEKGKKFLTFEGTADSVRKNLDCIEKYDPGIVLVLGGDHIYTMDYRDVILRHKTNDADITIMTNVVPDKKVKNFGIVKIDEQCRIVDFAEKPTDKAIIESFKLTHRMKNCLGICDPDLNFLASMGNYVFFWDRLKQFLKFPGMDFAEDIIPAIRKSHGIMYAYVFDGYWRDVGLIQDYFECNMEFAGDERPLDLLKNRIRTFQRNLPPACISTSAFVQGSILSSGDIVHRESVITNSVLGYQVVIDERCNLDHCVLLGADRNEFYGNHIRKEYTTSIGKDSNLSYVILDKNVWVGEGVDIGPENNSPEDREDILIDMGLKPYRELPDGALEGDFYIEPEMNILVIGKQNQSDPKAPILPDGLRC